MAAALARALLLVDSARQYGLIAGGPTTNVTRCEEVLARAQARGVVPTSDEIDGAIDALLHATPEMFR